MHIRIYIIFNSFEKIEFYKPTQNSFSNEFYIICHNYTNIVDNFDILFEILDDDIINKSIIENYTNDFLYQLLNALNKLITNFNYSIKRQIYYTENWDNISNEHKNELYKMIHLKNNDWIYLFLQKKI